MNINELVRRAKLGDNIAKERIILESKSFIKKVIKDTLPAFYYANCCYDDLYQEACIGVLSSVDTFDFDKKVNFYTYSYLVVRGCLLKTLKENGRFIKIPGDM